MSFRNGFLQYLITFNVIIQKAMKSCSWYDQIRNAFWSFQIIQRRFDLRRFFNLKAVPGICADFDLLYIAILICGYKSNGFVVVPLIGEDNASCSDRILHTQFICLCNHSGVSNVFPSMVFVYIVESRDDSIWALIAFIGCLCFIYRFVR